MTDKPTDLRDRIAAAIWERQNPGRRWVDCEYRWRADAEADADAVLAVLPPAADRAAVLLEAAEVSARFVSDCQTCAVELEVASGLRRLAAEAQQPDTETVTARDLAHAIDNSTPYPIELDSAVCQFMAERLLEMVAVRKRPEHVVWQPEEEPPATQPQPIDPGSLQPAVPVQPAADGSGEEAQFGTPGCLCKPWTVEHGKRRFMESGETVDRISGWHVHPDCPHHKRAGEAEA